MSFGVSGSGMSLFVGLCVWLVSLLIATWLGYERGRWAAGVVLGLGGGPLGALAAGLMQPSVEASARRAFAVQHRLAELHRSAKIARERRRAERARLDSLVNTVEQSVVSQEQALAEGLQRLAGELRGAARGNGGDGRWGAWEGWLQERAAEVHASSRLSRHELP